MCGSRYFSSVSLLTSRYHLPTGLLALLLGLLHGFLRSYIRMHVISGKRPHSQLRFVFFFLSCLYKTQQHLGYHSQVHLLNCQFVRFIGDFVVWVICIAREADPIVSQSVGKQSVKRSAAATQWQRVPTQATQEDSPLVDVLSRPCRCFLHSSCARLSHRLVNPQCLSHVATEVFTAEDKTQCGCIFDGHARALALIGHHLFGASLVSNPSNDSRTATKNREEQKGKEGREKREGKELTGCAASPIKQATPFCQYS